MQKVNPSQLRCDDYSFIGAALGAVITPAIFLRRASILSLITGGASLGLGAGTATHIVRQLTEGEDVRPEGMVSAASCDDTYLRPADQTGRGDTCSRRRRQEGVIVVERRRSPGARLPDACAHSTASTTSV